MSATHSVTHAELLANMHRSQRNAVSMYSFAVEYVTDRHKRAHEGELHRHINVGELYSSPGDVQARHSELLRFSTFVQENDAERDEASKSALVEYQNSMAAAQATYDSQSTYLTNLENNK